VTAGGVNVDLELSASAEGSTAVTSTQGSIKTTHTTMLQIAVDPSAPAPARARLLGVSAATFRSPLAKPMRQAQATCNARRPPTPLAMQTTSCSRESPPRYRRSARVLLSWLGSSLDSSALNEDRPNRFRPQLAALCDGGADATCVATPHSAACVRLTTLAFRRIRLT
jgi:hypothetical protein